MDVSLVMTVIGRDRPGLVDALAQAVAAQGGNWLESRMARLGGHFAGILRVQLPGEQESALVAALGELQEIGLTTHVHRDTLSGCALGVANTVLEIVGQDRPGIIRQISTVLAEFGVNVEELETECGSAAMSGEAIFKARFRVSIPAACPLDELRRRIECIAADLIVDVSFAEPR